MTLAFLIDECCERSLGEGLRDQGHDVIEIAAVSPSVGDGVVSETARTDHRILVTYDWGFGERAVRGAFPFRGLVIANLAGLLAAPRVQKILEVIAAEGEALEGVYLIIGIRKLRRRQLPAQRFDPMA